ncbi:MAG: hypothetical protein ACLFQX_01260 [Candidatus Kapaibacterium sp.]
MENNSKELIDFFRFQKKFYLALLVGQVIFVLLFTILRLGETEAFLADSGGIFYIIVPIIAIALIAFSIVSFNKRIRPLAAEADLSKKIAIYRETIVPRYAPIELATTVAAIAFFLTGDYAHLVIAMLSLVLYISIRPTPSKTADEMALAPADRARLENID